MKLDPNIEPEFQTYTETFDTSFNGSTEVWLCKSLGTFGIEQGEEFVCLMLPELLELQRIVNEAVAISGVSNEE